MICKTKHKKNSIKSIIKDGRQIRDLARIVEKFNEFFFSIGPSLSNSIKCRTGKNFQTYLNRHILTSSHFKPINEKDTEK